MHREGGVCGSGLNLSVTADAVPPPLPRGGLGIPRKLRLFARGSPTRGNGDDRRQWRKQGGAVGAAASRMRATAKQTLGAATRPCLRSRLRGCTKDSLPIIQNRLRVSPGAVSFAIFYTTKHHSGVVMSRFQYPHPAGRHDFSEYLAEKEAKTHSVRSWPLSCVLYRPNKSACVPVRYKYNSVSVW